MNDEFMELIYEIKRLNANLERLRGVQLGDEQDQQFVESQRSNGTRAQDILEMIKSKQAPQESKLRQMLNNLKRK